MLLKIPSTSYATMGDIFTVKDYNNFIKEFPNTDTIMVGRGIISNPALACEIKNIKKLNKDDLYKFYEKMFNDYKEILSGRYSFASQNERSVCIYDRLL